MTFIMITALCVFNVILAMTLIEYGEKWRDLHDEVEFLKDQLALKREADKIRHPAYKGLKR